MPQIQISLSDKLTHFVDSQVTSAGFATRDEYIGSLVQADRKRLEELLLEGINSPVRIEVTPEYWERMKDELKVKFGKAAAEKQKAGARE